MALSAKEILEKHRSDDLEGQDLSGVNLKKAALSGAKLAGCALVRAKLPKADLSGADLSGADLKKADLRNANLAGADLRGANLEKAALNGADLTGACFEGAKLSGASLKNAKLDKTNLRDADLSNAILIKVKATHSNLSQSDLSEADAVESQWEGTDFQGAKLAGSVWQNSGFIACDMKGIEGEETDLSLCVFQDCVLESAKLGKADLSNTLIERTSFQDADLSEAQFCVSEQSEVNFDRATLDGANFKSVNGYTEEQINAFGDLGVKVDKFYFRRAFRRVRKSRPMQIAIIATLLAIGWGGWSWYNNPENWSFERLDRQAQRSRIQHNLEEAKSHYTIVLQKFRKNPVRVAHAKNQLGYLALEQKKPAEARQIFQDVATMFPDQENAMILAELGIADSYRDQQKYDEAVKQYRAFAEKWKDFPQAVDAWDRMAKVYVLTGDPDKAESVYQLIISKVATDSGAVLRAEFDVANLLRGQGQYRAAKTRFAEMVERYIEVPQTAARAMVGLIQGMVQLNELEEATVKLQEMRTRFPEQVESALDAEIFIANAEARMADPKAAEQRYKKIMAEHSDSIQSLWAGSRLAALYGSLKRYDEALDVYKKLLDQYDDDMTMKNQLKIERAQILTQMLRLDDAIDSLKEVLAETDDDRQEQNAAIILGQTYLNNKQVDLARQVFVDLKVKYPDSPEAIFASLIGLGTIEKEQSNYSGAVEYFRQAAEVSAEDPVKFEAYSWIQRTFQIADDVEKEKEILQEMMKEFGRDQWRRSHMQLALAEVYKKEGDIAQAEIALREVADLEDAGTAISALNALLRLYADSDRPTKTDEIAREITRRFPDNQAAIFTAKLDQAGALYREGKKTEALLIYKEVSNSEDPQRRQQALSAMMNYHMEMGQYEELGAIYDTLISDYAKAPEVVFNAKLAMANAFRAQKRPEEAIKLFQEIISGAPKGSEKAWTYDGMAASYMDMREYEKAKDIYKRMISEYDSKANANVAYMAHMGMAGVHESQRDYDAARNEFETAAALTTNTQALAQTHAAWIRVSAEMGDVEAAERKIQDIKKQYLGQPEIVEQALFSIATALAGQGRRAEALKGYMAIAEVTKNPVVKNQALTSAAQVYADMGDRGKALAIYQKLIRQFSDNQQILDTSRFGMARVHLNSGNYRKAAEIFQAIAGESSNSVSQIQALSDLSKVEVTLGNLDAAKTALSQIVEKYPERPDALVQYNKSMAHIFQLQGRYDEAVEYYRKNVDSKLNESVQVEALSQIAGIFSDQGRFDDARQTYGKLEAVSPGSAGLRYNSLYGKAMIQRQNHQYSDALASFKEAMKLAPDENSKANASIAVAQTLDQMGDGEKAAENFDALIEQYARNPNVLAQAKAGKAEVLRAQEKHDEAIDLYNEIFNDAKNEGVRLSALSAIAQIQINQGKLKEAIKTFNSVIKDFGGNETARLDAVMGMGNVYQQMGQGDKALTAYRRIKAEASDESRRVWADTAVAQQYLALQRFDKATEVFRNIIESYPNNPQAKLDAKMGIANSLKEQQKNDEALEIFEQIARDHPKSRQAYWALMGIAQIKGQLGNLDAARKAYERINENFPQSSQQAADSRLNMCNLLRSSNRKNEALECFAEISKKYPKSRQAAWSMEFSAQIHTENQDYAKARETYESLLSEFEAFPQYLQQGHFGLAGLYAMEGEKARALEEYQKLYNEATEDGEKIRALDALANTHLAMGNSKDAEKVYSGIIEQYKNKPQVSWQARLGSGNVKMVNREYEEAEKIFARLARDAGKEYVANNALKAQAQALLEMDDLNGVDEVVTQLKKRFPLDHNGVIDIRMAVANKLRAENKFREALAQIDPVIKAYEGQPQTAWAMVAKAQILGRMDRAKESMAVYRDLIENYSSNMTALIDSHMGIAVNHADAEEWAEAVEQYDLVASKWPEYAQAAAALNAMSQIYQQAGDDFKLSDTLKRLIALDVADPNTKANAMISLASLYTQQRRNPQAIDQYQGVYTNYPGTTQAAWGMLSAARLWNEGGNQEKAVELFNEVIAGYPEDHEAVIGAKAALEEIYKR